MKGERKRTDEGTRFWTSYKSETPSEKVKFKAEFATVLPNLFMAKYFNPE